MENTPSKKHKKRTRNEPEEYPKSSPDIEGSLRKNYDLFGARGGDVKRAKKTNLQGSEVTVTGDTDGHKTDESGERRKTKRKKDLENDGFENGNKSCPDESGGTTDGITNKMRKNRKREAEDEKTEDLDGISKEEKKDKRKKKRQKRAAKENEESCENVCSLDGVASKKAKKKRRRESEEVSKNGSKSRDSDASTPDETSDLTKKRKKGKEDAENDINDSHGCSPESKRKKKRKRDSGEENTRSDKEEKKRVAEREKEVKRNVNIVKGKGDMDGKRRLVLTENEQENTDKKKEKKKKKDKKRSSNEMEETAKTDEEGQKEPEVHPALIYLDCWKNDRANWHFKKVRQVWLLQNMFNVDKVPKDKFRILVKYLEGIKGGARRETVRKAEELLQKDEDNAVIQNRVKQVVQILAEQE